MKDETPTPTGGQVEAVLNELHNRFQGDGNVTDNELRDWVRDAIPEHAALREEVERLKEQLDWQNQPNRNPASRGAYEFYVNEEWTCIRDAAMDTDPGFHASLLKRRYDPDDERVRVRRVLDDDELLSDLASANSELVRLRKENVELKEKLAAIGEMAVVDWDDGVVGVVDAALKGKEPIKYKDRLRALFVEMPAELARLREENSELGSRVDALCNESMNIADTLRSRGFPDAPGVGVAQRVIQMAQELDTLRATNAGLVADKERLEFLFNLTDRENDEGQFRATLQYDNYQDGAWVVDGGGNVIGDCHDIDKEPNDQFRAALDAARAALDAAKGGESK